MPKGKDLQDNGDWKYPWEFPAGMSVQLPTNIESRDRDRLSRMPADRYWASRGHEAAFVGLSPEAATKHVDDLLMFFDKHKEELAKEKMNEDQFRIILMGLLRMYHPASPTLAAYQEFVADSEVNYWAKAKADPKKQLTPEEAQELQSTNSKLLFANLSGGGGFKERLIDAYTLNQRWTRVVFYRADKWELLARLGDAIKVQEDLLREAVPGLKDGPIYGVEPPEKLLTDPRWIAAEKRVNELLGDSGGPDGFIKQNQIHFATCVVNVRVVSPDALDSLKDITDKDAKRLEEKLNAFRKIRNELGRPRIEQQFEMSQQQIMMAENNGDKETANRWRKELTQSKQKWAEQLAEITKVQKREGYGQNCYVISNRYVFVDDKPTAIVHTACIRNGTIFVEFEIFSTMSKEEAAKDLEFWLKAMHEGTLFGRGDTH